MQATADSLEFAPPPTRGWVRALLLALAAHALLMAALTWGISWKRDSVSVVAAAELWSAVPQEAAPAPAPAPEPPPPPPPVAPTPKALPEPPTKMPDVDPDIALEREKKRKRLERIEEIRKEQEDRRKQAVLDKEKKKQAALDKEKQRQEQLEREKKLAQEKQEKLAKQAKQAKAAAQQEQLDAQRIEATRQENLKRMMAGVAGATGTSESTGTARQSSGPSATYAGKIVERIRNNTSFTDASAGKPTVIVDVRVNASGAITSRRVTQPSGNRAYDDAVLKAIDKMEFLPRDSDGRIPALVLTEGLELKVTL